MARWTVTSSGHSYYLASTHVTTETALDFVQNILGKRSAASSFLALDLEGNWGATQLKVIASNPFLYSLNCLWDSQPLKWEIWDLCIKCLFKTFYKWGNVVELELRCRWADFSGTALILHRMKSSLHTAAGKLMSTCSIDRRWMSDSISTSLGTSLGLLAIPTKMICRQGGEMVAAEDIISAWERQLRRLESWLSHTGFTPLSWLAGVQVRKTRAALIARGSVNTANPAATGGTHGSGWQHTNTTQLLKQKQMATVKEANRCQQRLSWGQPILFRGAGVWQSHVITLW